MRINNKLNPATSSNKHPLPSNKYPLLISTPMESWNLKYKPTPLLKKAVKMNVWSKRTNQDRITPDFLPKIKCYKNITGSIMDLTRGEIWNKRPRRLFEDLRYMYKCTCMMLGQGFEPGQIGDSQVLNIHVPSLLPFLN